MLSDTVKISGWILLFPLLGLKFFLFSRRAGKSLRRIPEHYRRRILKLLLILRENPVPTEYYDIKKLKGYANLYRARIGASAIRGLME